MLHIAWDEYGITCRDDCCIAIERELEAARDYHCNLCVGMLMRRPDAAGLAVKGIEEISEGPSERVETDGNSILLEECVSIVFRIG